MSGGAWASIALLVAALAVGAPLLGGYMAKVFAAADGSAGRAPGDRVFGPIERLIYRAVGVDPKREQRWNVYAISVLAFSVVGVLLLYLLQRIQGGLPFNATNVDGVQPALAWNTAVSFVTNTNWQNYAPEVTMSHLTQMLGLAVQNFVSAAVGISIVVALIRGLTRKRRVTIGNFWVDLVRCMVRILVPLSIVAALVLVSQGAIQNLQGNTIAHTVEGAQQVVSGGPFASQEAIKELGTNGGGVFNANSAHPFSNPNGFTDFFEIFMLLLIPFSLTAMFGKLVKDKQQGRAVLAAMFVLWAGSATIATKFEVDGNSKLDTYAIDQDAGADQTGGNMEGKEIRFGPAMSGVFAASSTGTSTGAVNSMHDSFTPGGGAVPLVNMMLGEVSPGGVGSGLYGMLVFAILAVFIAGLMVGRTPEYLGKKIQTAEMKLITIYILLVPMVVLIFASASVTLGSAKRSIFNSGPHGLTEVTYAFASAGNNNGSAFGGLSGNTDWYNTTLGLSMLVGRFLLMVPVLALAGSLARKQPVPKSAGTLPTGTPLFAGLLIGVVLIVVGLTYFPVVALGPIVEQLGL
jgi:K+-transporting ATPase ATPase A chain